ncbi:MAG TPA: response regulator [Fibrobacteres bacterium]|jgi:two-component system, chemotaxis family, chemotaxis protein CheY|nr:response regulator [Fibrobacterota bacterium]
MKFLIVEDDFVSYTVLEKILSAFGMSVIATDGLSAVKTFESALKANEYFDLICLDIMLPGADGQNVLKQIREIEEKKGIFGKDKTRIVMVTALNDNKNILEAFRSQCEGYIVKPISKEKMIDQLIAVGLINESVKID